MVAQEMHAGRELDVLIAQRVFGCVEGKFAPAYSTDIRCAWAVVETMGGRGFPVWGAGALISLGTPSENTCYAQFAAGWPCVWHRAEATTAPLAICLAALKSEENRPAQPYKHPDDCDHPHCRAAESF